MTFVWQLHWRTLDLWPVHKLIKSIPVIHQKGTSLMWLECISQSAVLPIRSLMQWCLERRLGGRYFDGLVQHLETDKKAIVVSLDWLS